MRKVDALSRLSVQPLVPHRADHAHNRVPGFVVLRRPEADALSKRAFVRPVLARQPLVNDRHLRRFLRIELGEVAAREERNAERAKVTRRDDAMLDDRRLPDWQNGVAFDRQAAAPLPPPSGRSRDSPGSFDTGHMPNALHQLPEEISPALVALYFALGNDHRQRQHIFRVQSGVNLLQAQEALHHQPGADQQHQRERDFRHDEQAARAVARPRQLRCGHPP